MPPWRDVRVLRIVGQAVVVVLILFAGYVLWTNLTRNMADARLGFGLDFLRATAGFDISQTVVPYSPRDSYGQAFLAGLINTLLVSVVGIFFATILGIVVGVARLSSNWLVNRIAAGYVEVMRNTPLLVQLVLDLRAFPAAANGRQRDRAAGIDLPQPAWPGHPPAAGRRPVRAVGRSWSWSASASRSCWLAISHAVGPSAGSRRTASAGWA